MKGNTAISGYAEGATLIALFGLLPFVDRVSETVHNFLQDTSNGLSSGGGGCGSSGGCSGGGSCGGGCGGGCGGCGS